MVTEVEQIALRINGAKRPEEIFGELEGDTASVLASIKVTFRKLSRAIHPDRNDNSTIATEAFARLSQMRDWAITLVNSGKYGVMPTVTVKTRLHSYEVGAELTPCGVANAYQCTIDDTDAGVFTVARQPVDNDLMQNEVRALTILREEINPGVRGYLPMLPSLVESLTYSEGAGVRRQANIFEVRPGYVSIADILQACPDGIHPADMAWMWRRLLDILGYCHSRKVIHGAVLPGNVLIGTGDVHDVVLTNWQACVRDFDTSGKYIAVVETDYQDWYPAEVIAKETPTPSTDILMSARCMIALLGGNPVTGVLPDSVHARERGFLQSCLFEKLNLRPQSAWQLREEFGKMLVELRGKLQYRPFYMPA